MFASAGLDGIDMGYTRAYAVGGFLTAGMILTRNFMIPGGISLARLVGGILTSIAWMQAE